MNDEIMIESQDDVEGRDKALSRLRALSIESAQVSIHGIELWRRSAHLELRSHTGVESGHVLDYPVTWSILKSALLGEDEEAVVRSEAVSAVLDWMRDEGVPTSEGFEEFFRWAVFEDLVVDGDHLALLDAGGAPIELPVGWHYEPDKNDPNLYLRTEQRPHLAERQDRTWLLMRVDGWSALLFDRIDWIGSGPGQTPAPAFVTLRQSNSEDAAWFRNEEVDASELISFNRDFYKFSDRT